MRAGKHDETRVRHEAHHLHSVLDTDHVLVTEHDKCRRRDPL
jgi:hypothetical protein